MSTPFYDLASLVLVPSGTKAQKIYAQKPLTTDGQLAFTRSTTATRVASNGLIEKVRTNLLLQSNTFTNATWDKLGVSVTAGQAGYDGTNNATLITVTSVFPRLQQNFTNTGLQTLSVYAKAATYNYLFINSLQNGGGDNASFDLVAGTQVVSFATQVSSSITSVGNGWWKIVVAFSNTTFGSIAFGTSVDGSVPSWSAATAGSVLIQNAQIETGDIATPYIATTTAAVSVGPVANVPRLDYLNSSCPRLLLEPQRSNLVGYSEQMDNAAWTKQAGTVVTANAAISPDGYQNADLVVGTGNGIFQSGKTVPTTTPNTKSVYLKGVSGGEVVILQDPFQTVGNTVCTLTTNWQRFTLTETQSGGLGGLWIAGIPAGGIYVYGCQLEAGAYATSYIPTLGAAVTRGADAASKTSATALIGQTAGTLYSEFIVNGFANFGTALCVNNGGTTESIWLTTFANGDIRAEVYSTAGGGVQASFTKSGNVVGQTYKIAIGYAANNFAFFVNGLQVGSTDTSGSVPVSMSRVDFDYTIPASYVVSALGIKQALLFTTRLTNAQLAELTA